MPAKPWPSAIQLSTAGRSRIGRVPVVLAKTMASIPARPDGDSIVATSSAVRQKGVEKIPERRPMSVIVASAIGMELCLKPSVCVTTSTRAGWSIDVSEEGLSVRDAVSLEHDDNSTPARSPQSQPRPVIMRSDRRRRSYTTPLTSAAQPYNHSTCQMFNRLPPEDRCPECDGTGVESGCEAESKPRPCSACHGEGLASEEYSSFWLNVVLSLLVCGFIAAVSCLAS